MSENETPSGVQLTELDPAFRADPFPRLKALREAAPIVRDEFFGAFWLTRFQDVRALLSDRSLWRSFEKAEEPCMFQRNLKQEHPELKGGGKPSGIIFLDDPDHARVRTPIAKALYARVAKSRAAVERLVDETLAPLLGRSEFDLMSELADIIPIMAIGRILGVPDERMAEFRAWSQDIVLYFNPIRTEMERQRLVRATLALQSFFDAEITLRREHPRDDLISDIILAQESGTELSNKEIRDNCIGLMVGGNLTTTDLIGNAIYLLLTHPNELAKLNAEPSLINDAVEEVLRFLSPVDSTSRIAPHDMEVAGCPVKATQAVMTQLQAANRDPAQFEAPDEFNITRAKKPHIAFGGGAHICIGAPLARLEAQIALPKVFAAFPNLRLADEVPEWKSLPFFRGLAQLNVRN